MNSPEKFLAKRRLAFSTFGQSKEGTEKLAFIMYADSVKM